MITTDGCLKFLEAIRQAILAPSLIGGDTVKIVLFTDDFTPAAGLTWASLSAKEATYAGYARQNAATFYVNAPAVVSAQAKVLANAATFAKTVGTADATVYGVGLVLCDAGGVVLKLLEAYKLAAPNPLTDLLPSVNVEPYAFGVGV